jgi:DNA-binding LacI/PurR family transcriptional regulator
MDAADRRPTLADVAAAAGVSRATASRALSEGHYVSEATREKVWAAAQRLAFEPNHMARSLRTRSSKLVGMLLPDIAVASYAAALKGAQSVLEQAGYQVLVMNTEREPERETAALRTLYARHVDGVLVATSGGEYASSPVVISFIDPARPSPPSGTDLQNAVSLFDQTRVEWPGRSRH